MKTKFTILLLLIVFQSSAQNYGNIWQFGNNVGLDFNNCEPVVINGGNSGFEGCSSISDVNGQLLFYTNSEKVWNNSHTIMPNGNINFTNGTLSQVLIIPKPQSNNLFYIITTQVQAAGSLKLQYHEVNMNLNSGSGDVSSANNILTTSTITEQVCATYHNNGVDIWLVVHEYGTNNFMSFLVTSSGINLTPVISSTGPSHSSSTSNFNARGEIKFSPDGSKLAFNGNGEAGNDATNILCLLDFDNITGILSNPINLPFSRGEFGLSFSPDNTKLYGTTWKALMFTLSDYNYLYQFDLTSGDSSTIVNSKEIIDSMVVPYSYGTLKIGPDAKIYVRYLGTDFLGVINSPNQLGVACDYEKNGLYIGNQSTQYGLNNYIEYVNYCNVLSVNHLDPTTNNKHLIKIVDLMGRETEDKPNSLLIYIYSDGTTEKVFRVDN